MASTPRDAATVILARPTDGGGYEVLLTRRPESMAFMGGAYVFPGGARDDGDSGDALTVRSALSAEEARDRLGEDIEPSRALGLFCAGVRELFEEVGVLLARDPAGRPVDPGIVLERYAPRQAELAHDPEGFAAFLTEEGLTLATDLLVPHGRLVTPEVSPIRFDARFFAAPFPEGQEVVPDPEEVPETCWMTPADAIAAGRAEELDVPIPTMAILQGLSEAPSYEALLHGRTKARQVEAEEVSPLVSRILAPNPGLATGPGTNTYVVASGEETVIIDPAVPDPVFVEAVTQVAGNRGRTSMILLTHLHPDHIGGVATLAEQFGCEVAGWEGATDESPLITRPLADGEEIHLGDVTLRVLHTPGHASHHLCFRLENEGSLFAGDVVAGAGTVVIAPPDGDMGDYLTTLERLLETGVGRIYPGHGPVIDDGEAKLREYVAHRRDRERQVLDALESGLETIPEMVKRIYADIDEALHPMAEMSVRAHLDMLEGEGRVDRRDDRWILSS